MQDLKEIVENYSDFDNESKFARISDDIWQLGSLEEIKEEVSHEAFIFHVAINMIGNWKCDGWDFIFAERRELLPYIPEALEALGLEEIKELFDRSLRVLPSFAIDSDEESYVDIINFFINPRFKVVDERLKAISVEDRKRMSAAYHENIRVLDGLCSQLWGYGAEADGWKNVLAYLGQLGIGEM